MTVESFLEECQRLLDSDDYILMHALLTQDAPQIQTENAVGNAWLRFNRSFRNELVWFRAGRLNKDPLTFVRGQRWPDPFLTEQIHQAAKTANQVIATTQDPSAALAALTSRIIPPSAVAWGAQFAGLFGFNAPGVLGGNFPVKPRDVNYLVKKEIGKKINELLSSEDRIVDGFFTDVTDALSGFAGLSPDEVEQGLGNVLKSTLGFTDSPLGDAEFAKTVKLVAAEMGTEGAALLAATSSPEALATRFQRFDPETAVGLSKLSLNEAQQLYEAGTISGSEYVVAERAAFARGEDLRLIPSETNEELARINQNISINNQIVARADEELNAARELRSSPDLTAEDKAEIDAIIVDSQVKKALALTVVSRSLAEQARVIQEQSVPLSNSEDLRSIAGRVPTEQRFSSLIPVSGEGARVESVNTSLGTTQLVATQDDLVVKDELSLLNEKIALDKEIVLKADVALDAARDIRDTPGLLPSEVADLDAIIVKATRSREEALRSASEGEKERVRLLKNQPLPPEGVNKANRIPGTSQDNTFFNRLEGGRPTNTSAAAAAGQTFPVSNTGTGSSSGETSTGSQKISGDFEVTVKAAARDNPEKLAEFIRNNPGSTVARAARAALPNSEESLADRAEAAVVALEQTPPTWLSNFITQHLNNQ